MALSVVDSVLMNQYFLFGDPTASVGYSFPDFLPLLTLAPGSDLKAKSANLFMWSVRLSPSISEWGGDPTIP